MRTAGTPHVVLREHSALQLGDGASLSVLAPPSQLYASGGGSAAASNDMVLRADMPGLRVLFLGAADAYARDALAGSGEPLAADVVEVAVPHGEPLALTGPLLVVLARAHPRLLVLTEAPLSAQAAASRLRPPPASPQMIWRRVTPPSETRSKPASCG